MNEKKASDQAIQWVLAVALVAGGLLLWQVSASPALGDAGDAESTDNTETCNVNA